MKGTGLTLIVFLALSISTSVFSAEVDPGEFGILYNCGYPVTVKLDGNFSDWPGSVPWHSVDHTMGWTTPGNDKDGSFDFACVADENYLYVAVKINDDKKCVDENLGGDVYKDDSIELYIDGDNNKALEYEPDVSQITIGRYNIGVDPKTPKLNAWTGNSGKGLPADQSGTMVAVVDTDYGYAMEIAVPLATYKIKLADGALIGFNVQLNDDDDNGERDHKLSWSEAERKGGETAYFDPSVFGELMFRKDFLAVSGRGKLANTWGEVKNK